MELNNTAKQLIKHADKILHHTLEKTYEINETTCMNIIKQSDTVDLKPFTIEGNDKETIIYINSFEFVVFISKRLNALATMNNFIIDKLDNPPTDGTNPF